MNDMQNQKTQDPWTAIRARKSTVKKLETFKTNEKESLESVIKRAISQEIVSSL